MKQIRNNVFETNSSSTHSLSIYKEEFKYDGSLKSFVDYDNYLHITFGEFGWGDCCYDTAYEKLQYLVTFVAEKCPYEEVNVWCCGHPMDMDKIYDCFNTRDDFNDLNDLIKQELNCNGIWLDEGEGYIDHQSHEDYATINDLLKDWGFDSMYDFIFNRNSYVHTDNDNH